MPKPSNATKPKSKPKQQKTIKDYVKMNPKHPSMKAVIDRNKTMEKMLKEMEE